MIILFILFFFGMYCLCEAFKITYSKKGKRKLLSDRVYNKPIVYIKTVFISVFYILLIINRLLPSGRVEQSTSVRTTFIVYLFFLCLVGFSVYECIRVKKGQGPIMLHKED